MTAGGNSLQSAGKRSGPWLTSVAASPIRIFGDSDGAHLGLGSAALTAGAKSICALAAPAVAHRLLVQRAGR